VVFNVSYSVTSNWVSIPTKSFSFGITAMLTSEFFLFLFFNFNDTSLTVSVLPFIVTATETSGVQFCLKSELLLIAYHTRDCF